MGHTVDIDLFTIGIPGAGRDLPPKIFWKLRNTGIDLCMRFTRTWHLPSTRSNMGMKFPKWAIKFFGYLATINIIPKVGLIYRLYKNVDDDFNIRLTDKSCLILNDEWQIWVYIGLRLRLEWYSTCSIFIARKDS